MDDDENLSSLSSPDVPRGTSDEDPSAETRVMFHVEHWPLSLQDYATALEDGLDAFLERVESGSVRLARISQLKCWDVMSEMVNDVYRNLHAEDRGSGPPLLQDVGREERTTTPPQRTTLEKRLVRQILAPQRATSRRLARGRYRMRGRRAR